MEDNVMVCPHCTGSILTGSDKCSKCNWPVTCDDEGIPVLSLQKHVWGTTYVYPGRHVKVVMNPDWVLWDFKN